MPRAGVSVTQAENRLGLHDRVGGCKWSSRAAVCASKTAVKGRHMRSLCY
jgi:hypothetical protein